ncbi:RNA polymerase factor sigma-54 [candidate division TA06 bacterium]|nr:RNA polymerase factor sigma-54 [candidate division TA06 bacterium]
MELELRTELKLTLTPQLIELLKLLQLPRLELEQLVRTELEANPLLEEGSEETDEDEQESGETEEVSSNEKEEAWEEYLQEDMEPIYRSSWKERQDFQAYQPVATTTFREYLMNQLHLASRNQETTQIGEYIIDSLDEDGRLSFSEEAIAEDLGVEPEKVEETLKLVQTLDPTGVGARDLKECLLIQLRSLGKEKSIEARIVEFHLEDLKNKNYERIAQALEVTLEEVKKAIEAISSLEPKPGRWMGTGGVRYVVPDVLVEKGSDGYRILLNETNIPHLRISRSYREILRNVKGNSQEARDFVRSRLASARFMVTGLEERRKTILKVVKFLVNTQREFLEGGLEHLAPLNLKDVADAVGIHESTVSRVLKGKFIQTPHGVFDLKYFFSGGAKRQDNEKISTRRLQERIRQLIIHEGKKCPLTDRQIAEKLKTEGFDIARRTVGKYRDVMKILPAKLRREV